jgi:hypothetical protein
MATAVGTDTVSTIARRHILPTVSDAIYGSNVLFYRMVKANKKMIQGGVHIEQPVNYARSGLGGAYRGYEQLSTAAFDVIRAAAWDWKQYHFPVAVDGLTMLKVDSPESILNHIKMQFELAKTEFCDMLGNDLYASTGTGADAKKIDGLTIAVDNSGVYGDINHSNAYWQSTVVGTQALTSLTVAQLQTMFGGLTVGREHPTIILSRQEVYNWYWAQVYGTSGANYDIQIPATGSDELLGQAGFTNLLFNNVPWVVDSQVDGASNGKVYMLNENWFHLVVNPRADMAMEEFQTPVNQDAMVSQILWAGNLICTNPRLQGCFDALT